MSVSTWFPCPTFFTILRLCASIITICHGRGRAVLSRLAKLIFNFFYFLFISFFVCLFIYLFYLRITPSLHVFVFPTFAPASVFFILVQ